MTIVVAGLVLLSAPLFAQPAGAAPPAVAKIDHAVLAQTEAGSTSTFFVMMKDQPDLSAAVAGTAQEQRTQRVYQTRTTQAGKSQEGVRKVLADRKINYTPYWIANTIKVTGDKKLVTELARRSDVASILPDRSYPLVEPVKISDAPAAPAGVEWNIDRIGAPQVWSAYGKGRGVVVGTVDTGADASHPAIARQYRGARGGPLPGHDYNWFDPSRVCDPYTSPCDNIGHGTHVLGTILGDDGKGNQIGVAPQARWIAAKGCETNGCSLSALLAAGQWIVAPTDQSGANPRPDLAPDVVNNSWGGGSGDPFYQQIVSSWVAAGIVPVFSNGNAGPDCATAGSPGDYTDSFAVGAYDRNNAIADFSSRGPGGFGGEAKPELAAPGVEIRSAAIGGGYRKLDGTSMAAPHVTGTIALAIGAAPALRHEVAAVTDLLNYTAVPTADGSCGGTDADNNVWGHGRMDAFAAVSKAPRGKVGAVGGTVNSGGQPLAGARVEVRSEVPRAATTDAQGQYGLRALPVGKYDMVISAFGYTTKTVKVTISRGTTRTVNVSLDVAPRYTLSGRVTDSAGRPVAEVAVSLPGIPVAPVTTDAAGAYQMASVPGGSYDLLYSGKRCLQEVRKPVVLSADTVLDVVLPAKSDGQGHICETVPTSWVDTDTAVELTGDDASTVVALPFPVEFYGATYQSVNVSTNGLLSFTSATASFFNAPIPAGDAPGAAVFAFWDDLFMDSSASVHVTTTGDAPDRRFVIEWRDITFYGAAGGRISIEVVMAEDGTVTVQYRGTGSGAPRTAGDSASVGIQDAAGAVGLQYSFNTPVLTDDTAIVFRRA